MYKYNANNYVISNLIYIQVFWFQTEGYPIFVLNESQIADDRFELGRSNDDDWGLQIHDVTEWDAGTYRCLLNTKPVQMKTLHLTVLSKSTLSDSKAFIIEVTQEKY